MTGQCDSNVNEMMGIKIMKTISASNKVTLSLNVMSVVQLCPVTPGKKDWKLNEAMITLSNYYCCGVHIARCQRFAEGFFCVLSARIFIQLTFVFLLSVA